MDKSDAKHSPLAGHNFKKQSKRLTTPVVVVVTSLGDKILGDKI
jgi:hypothetical protein